MKGRKGKSDANERECKQASKAASKRANGRMRRVDEWECEWEAQQSERKRAYDHHSSYQAYKYTLTCTHTHNTDTTFACSFVCRFVSFCFDSFVCFWCIMLWCSVYACTFLTHTAHTSLARCCSKHQMRISSRDRRRYKQHTTESEWESIQKKYRDEDQIFV